MSPRFVRVRLVVLAVEPADRVGRDAPEDAVTTVFIKRGLFAAALPRPGDRIEARSLGPQVALLFGRAPQVAAVEHRLTDRRTAEPVAYVIVELETSYVTDEMIGIFQADGYRVERKHDDPLPPL